MWKGLLSTVARLEPVASPDAGSLGEHPPDKPVPRGAAQRRVPSPLEWSAASRCVLVASVTLTLIAAFWWAIRSAAHDPGSGYADCPFAAWVGWALPAYYGSAWLVFALWAFAARSLRPNSRLLVHVMMQLCAAWGFVSYWMGHFSSLYPATIASGFAVLLVLFEPRPVLAGFVSFLAIILGTTVAENAGWIPHAPLMIAAPLQEDRLATSWLSGTSGIAFLSFLMAIAVIAWLVTDWRRREDLLGRAATALSAYLPVELAERILRGEEVRIGAPERRRVTVFFSDVEGFTLLADRLEPEELSTLLNEYLAAMAKIAAEHGATLSQMIGDGLMVILGAPEPAEDLDHAWRCVQMAVAMQAAVAALRAEWEARGLACGFHVRMALNTGYASVGNFGAPGRVTYSAIGTQMNLTARLQSEAPPDGVLLSHTTWALVRDRVDGEARGQRVFKGIREPVAVYELRGLREATSLGLSRV